MKRLHIWLSVLAMLMSINAFAATEYHGQALYGLEGTVKKVKLKTKAKRSIIDSNPEFMNNGLLCFSHMYYDDEGYPLGSSFVIGDNNILEVDVKYNESKRVNQISEVYHKGSTDYQTVESFEYSPDGTMVKETITSTDSKSSKEKSVVMTYSDYSLDAAGNWISRKVSSTTTQTGKAPKSVEFVETRQISYY
ncbi:MAG: hypothetical protein K2L83_01580 [Muribaculaceae bacterium]|nr:hypothetical protein [Muribaculaceae bacterium]